MSRSMEIGDRVTDRTLSSMTAGPPAQPPAQTLARINSPTVRNAAVFGLSLLPWPTGIAIAVAILTRHVDPRIWPALTVAWSAVEFAIRNPHRVTLERRAADSTGRRAYALEIRSWWQMLIRSRGETIALGPDSRLVQNEGVIDCATGKLIELRIYRWQFSELVLAFGKAGFEVHDECHVAGRPRRKRAPILLVSAVAVTVVALAAVAFAVVEIHGL